MISSAQFASSVVQSVIVVKINNQHCQQIDWGQAVRIGPILYDCGHNHGLSEIFSTDLFCVREICKFGADVHVIKS